MKTLFEEGGKAFLTPNPEEDSSISWHSSVDHFSNNSVDYDGTVKIRDCHKLVRLEFYIDSDRGLREPQSFEHRLNKIDNLIAQLGLFRDSMIKGYHKKLEAEKWLQR